MKVGPHMLGSPNRRRVYMNLPGQLRTLVVVYLLSWSGHVLGSREFMCKVYKTCGMAPM